MDLTKRSVIVTGATGFIGKKFMTAASGVGIGVIPFTGDITDESAVSGFFSHTQADSLIHLAGIHDGTSEELTRTNVEGTGYVVSSAVLHDIRHIIFASSGAVYGNVPAGKTARETDVLAPCNPYGISKAQAEAAVRETCERHRIVYTILRLGSVYGPDQTAGILPSLLRSIDGSATVSYDLEKPVTRQFVHVNDVVHILIKVLDTPVSGMLNTASDDVYSIGEIVTMLGTRYEFRKMHRPSRNPYTDMRMELSKLRSLTDFFPSHTLREYILQ